MRVYPLPANRIRQAAEVLAAAFAKEPTIMRMVPPNRHKRHEKIAAYFRWSLRSTGLENVDIAVSAADDSVLGVALWEPPLHRAHTLKAALILPAAYMALGRRGLNELASYERAVAPYALKFPHWYLADIGTSPQARGRGVGKLMIDHRLRIIDAAGEHAALTATSDGSRKLYERHGFTPLHELRLVDGSVLTMMLRPPVHRP